MVALESWRPSDGCAANDPDEKLQPDALLSVTALKEAAAHMAGFPGRCKTITVNDPGDELIGWALRQPESRRLDYEADDQCGAFSSVHVRLGDVGITLIFHPERSS